MATDIHWTQITGSLTSVFIFPITERFFFLHACRFLVCKILLWLACNVSFVWAHATWTLDTLSCLSQRFKLSGMRTASRLFSLQCPYKLYPEIIVKHKSFEYHKEREYFNILFLSTSVSRVCVIFQWVFLFLFFLIEPLKAFFLPLNINTGVYNTSTSLNIHISIYL